MKEGGLDAILFAVFVAQDIRNEQGNDRKSFVPANDRFNYNLHGKKFDIVTGVKPKTQELEKEEKEQSILVLKMGIQLVTMCLM